jgi:hypothetical protein
MKVARRSGLGVSLGVLLLTLMSVVSVSAAAPAEEKAAAPPITTGPQPLCANVTPSCGDTCSNTPFELTKCWTTTYGPAKADVVVVPASAKVAAATSSPNMLSCQGGGYALCFFSGPPTAISGGPNALPCKLRPDGLVADCTCQYYSSGTYYVDINGILNQGAYYEAVKQCGPDGSGCSNIVASSTTTANVCTYVNNQPLDNPAGSFYPTGAQVVSTFSFAMSPPNGSYSLSTKPATCNGKYAGCMTAPCRFADGSSPASHKDGDPIQCECPVYDGDYQVGASGQACTIPSSDGNTYIWSASNTVVDSGN